MNKMSRNFYHLLLHAIAVCFEKICILLQRFMCRDGYLLFDNLDGASCEAIDCFTLYEYLHAKGIRVRYLTTDRHLAGKYGADDGSIVYLRYSPMSVRGALALFPLGLAYRFVVTSHGRINFLWARIWKHSPHCVYVHSQHGPTFFKGRSFAALITPACFDAVVVSNDLEKQMAIESGWSASDIFKTGLFRFDRLNMCVSKDAKPVTILVMFTWRSGFDGTEADSVSVEKSVYCHRLQSLLTNERLLHMVHSGSIRLVFAPHHYFLDHGKGTLHVPHYVALADVRCLSKVIREADLLITDYSSVCFDFLYQRKPVVFYPLDYDDAHMHRKDRDDQEHARSMERYIFNVARREEDVVRLVEEYVRNGCRLSEEQAIRVEDYFSSKGDACRRFVLKCSEYIKNKK